MKPMKVLIIIAVSLIIVGAAAFTVIMSINGWDIRAMSTVNYVTNKYTLDEDFNDFDIYSYTANINFVPATDGKCTVTCYEEERRKHNVSVEAGKLVIKAETSDNFTDWIGISASTPMITVALPKTAYDELNISDDTGSINIPTGFSFASADIYSSTGSATLESPESGNVKIHLSTGSISLKNISAGSLDLKVSTGAILVESVKCGGDVKTNASTGKTTLNSLTCSSLSSEGTTGSITLNNTIVSGKLYIKRSTGSVLLNESDAAELKVETSTGSVKGTLLSDKIFFTTSDTGRITVPKTISGGTCDIKTTTGNINISIKE